MIRKCLCTAVFVLVFFNVSGFSEPQKLSVPYDMVVATVNGRPITGRLLEVEARLPITLLRIKQENMFFYDTLLGTDEGYDLLILYKEQILENLIHAYVLFDLAEAKGVGVSDREVEQFVGSYLDDVLDATGITADDFENYIMLQGYESLDDYRVYLAFQRKLALTNVRLMEIMIPEPTVSRQEIEAYKLENPADLSGQLSAHITHILLETQQQALEVMNVLNTMDFEEAARQYSQDELTRRSGGDLGWLEQGAFRQFDVVFSHPAGTVVGPVQTPLGFHLLRAKAIKGGEHGESHNEEEIRREIKLEKRFILWQKWLQEDFGEWINQATIEVFF